MSDASDRLKSVAKTIIAVAGLMGGAGVVLWNTIPTSTPNLSAPCQGAMCVALMRPPNGQCPKLLQGGGEMLMRDPGAVDPYAGAGGQAGRILAALRAGVPPNESALDSWHTDAVTASVDGGPEVPTGACCVRITIPRTKVAAWRASINAADVASALVPDGRFAGAPAACKRGGAWRSVLAGQPSAPTVYPDGGTDEEIVDTSEVPNPDGGP
jgi:hypothetical protein